ncbi:MAG: hypothetical protein IRZ33_06325 [Alicyclobacillaceae bacterium]|nr:hypothetical protein [Alicyclobacillaceae bacterium]
MLKFVASLVVPVGVFVYTVSFARSMERKGQVAGAVSAYAIGSLAFILTCMVLWRMFM